MIPRPTMALALAALTASAGAARGDGLVTLESGLQYRVLRAGDGPRPTLADTVVVRYREGRAEEPRRGGARLKPRTGTFPLRAAIPGFREALQLMSAGARWELVVPPHLAGPRRAQGAPLVLDVELVSVAGRAGEGASRPAVGGPTVTGVEVAYRLDPRLTRGLYLGDRWVSPARFAAPVQGKTTAIDVIVRGVDAGGRPLAVAPEWRAADPAMVEVAAGRGGEARLTVKRAGASEVAVRVQGITQVLEVRASARGEGLAVEILQREPAPAPRRSGEVL